MTKKRVACPMRHENGNCLPAGGFCTAVNDCICEALHNAFDSGVASFANEYRKLKSQVNRLKEYDEKRDIALHSRLIATTRTETVNEFAEKTEKELLKIPQHHFTLLAVEETIEKVKKEMEGLT